MGEIKNDRQGAEPPEGRGNPRSEWIPILIAFAIALLLLCIAFALGGKPVVGVECLTQTGKLTCIK